MGNARTITAATLIGQVAHELRDTAQQQYTSPGGTAHDELFVYLNKCLEMIYMILTADNSELITTGSGTITTVDGTEAYDLSANSMGDFWAPAKINGGMYDGEWEIYVVDSSSTVYSPMEMVPYGERFHYLQSGTAAESRPTQFYLNAGNIGLLPVPDAAYTLTIPRYIPNFTPLSATSDNMPHYNLFNQQIVEGIKMIAKQRNNTPAAYESVMMDMFQARALEIANLRTKSEYRIKVRSS